MNGHVLDHKMEISSETTKGCFPPTYSTVENDQVTLKDYYVLYTHYAYSTKLPVDFPTNILEEFPSKNYKQQLKAAISELTNTVNELIESQNEYLKNYYALYMHYYFGAALPSGFPTCIVQRFPNDSYKEELKAAIANLQNEINHEKATQRS